MTSFIENVVIQIIVNATINQNLKNMMIKIQKMIFQNQRKSQNFQNIRSS